MLKKIFVIFTIFILTSCNFFSEEVKKTAKAASASGRINASEENSKNTFKELEE